MPPSRRLGLAMRTRSQNKCSAGGPSEPVSECGRTRGSPLPAARPGAVTTTCRASLARSRGYETGSSWLPTR